MSTSTTALMPLDPALSPEHLNRILPIRANLLPPEITAGRNARRTRILLAGVAALVVVVMGGWYWHADQQRDLAVSDLASVTGQADTIRKELKKKDEELKVTSTLQERDEIAGDLKTALTRDLPWQTLLDSLRTTATAKSVTLTTITGALAMEASGTAATSTTSAISGSLSLTGTAKDKPTIAGFVDAVGKVTGVTDAYLTAATQQDANWTFTLTADIKTSYLCGRFSAKTCPGGK
ncbi:hypothetical protein [Paractinoplanes globisporus]|uniref:Fimbrial assembly family protein n=1 Tax=Paractinoplanes globisporus TaxID=113565 RepID=A0ABW6WDB0_9ACTN|nr:hypothetical protein [Actinoplanes globisporus]